MPVKKKKQNPPPGRRPSYQKSSRPNQMELLAGSPLSAEPPAESAEPAPAPLSAPVSEAKPEPISPEPAVTPIVSEPVRDPEPAPPREPDTKFPPAPNSPRFTNQQRVARTGRPALKSSSQQNFWTPAKVLALAAVIVVVGTLALIQLLPEKHAASEPAGAEQTTSANVAEPPGAVHPADVDADRAFLASELAAPSEPPSNGTRANVPVAEPTPGAKGVATALSAASPAPGANPPSAREDFAAPAPPANVAAPQSGPAELMPSGKPWTNSLGMRFVPVGEVYFCVWETRVKDYEAFCKATGQPRARALYEETDNHPVVKVSWSDARDFCAWLTQAERAAGILPEGYSYRLPTDLEWSAAVGLSKEAGKTPEARDGGIKKTFPWGGSWPPARGAGNFADTAAAHEKSEVIGGYTDGFARTAPVGSFRSNRAGIFDLAGNVWEWCEDTYSSGGTYRVARGGSWVDAKASDLSSSYRNPVSPNTHSLIQGFRCVLAKTAP